MINTIQSLPVDLSQINATYKFSMIEHKVSLEDSLLQLMTEPEEFSLMNFDRLSKIKVPVPVSEETMLSYIIELS